MSFKDPNQFKQNYSFPFKKIVPEDTDIVNQQLKVTQRWISLLFKIDDILFNQMKKFLAEQKQVVKKIDKRKRVTIYQEIFFICHFKQHQHQIKTRQNVLQICRKLSIMTGWSVNTIKDRVCNYFKKITIYDIYSCMQTMDCLPRMSYKKNQNNLNQSEESLSEQENQYLLRKRKKPILSYLDNDSSNSQQSDCQSNNSVYPEKQAYRKKIQKGKISSTAKIQAKEQKRGKKNIQQSLIKTKLNKNRGNHKLNNYLLIYSKKDHTISEVIPLKVSPSSQKKALKQQKIEASHNSKHVKKYELINALQTRIDSLQSFQSYCESNNEDLISMKSKLFGSYQFPELVSQKIQKNKEQQKDDRRKQVAFKSQKQRIKKLEKVQEQGSKRKKDEATKLQKVQQNKQVNIEKKEQKTHLFEGQRPLKSKRRDELQKNSVIA